MTRMTKLFKLTNQLKSSSSVWQYFSKPSDFFTCQALLNPSESASIILSLATRKMQVSNPGWCLPHNHPHMQPGNGTCVYEARHNLSNELDITSKSTGERHAAPEKVSPLLSAPFAISVAWERFCCTTRDSVHHFVIKTVLLRDW